MKRIIAPLALALLSTVAVADNYDNLKYIPVDYKPYDPYTPFMELSKKSEFSSPDRYFYIDEAGNKIEQPVEEPVDPKSIDPTYMSLEERKALAKLKRQQDDADK